MLKERHANLVVTKIAEKLESVRNKRNADAIEKAKKDPRIKELKKLHIIAKKAENKRDALHNSIVKDIDGIAWMSDNGVISKRSKNTYPSKSELSTIKLDVIHEILRGKITDVDALIDKIVAERSK